MYGNGFPGGAFPPPGGAYPPPGGAYPPPGEPILLNKIEVLLQLVDLKLVFHHKDIRHKDILLKDIHHKGILLKDIHHKGILLKDIHHKDIHHKMHQQMFLNSINHKLVY